ncbi:MAG TPA: class I SAM-dependent methyltransferase, partial [Casimicrobiaceae bacterium]|nr:class I SAM-dependent methyltransferase [Casimicrobiaceae bacterium]
MIYRRTFDPASGDSLARLSRWMRPGASVLELGAAAGYFTRWLKEQGASVDVVDIDPEAGRAAEPYARRVVIADLDGDGWEAELAAGATSPRYDFIVCADVLEHLRDGARLLATLRALLKPGGELLLSVPNVAHAAIVAGLFDDRFEYGGEGLLDPTHLRLYTWRSLGALLRDAGFRILDWDATEVTPYASEFRTRVEALPPALAAALGPGTRHYAYQWLVRATPGAMDEIPPPRALEGAERVPVRLLPGATREALTLDRQHVDFIPANGEAATLEFRIAPGDAVFRIILSDRVGVIAIDTLTFFAGEREIWRLGAPGAVARPGFDAVALDEGKTYAL